MNKLILSGGTTGNVLYGLLYNWYAVNDASYIYANGWHVSTTAELQMLADYPTFPSGGKLKETGNTYWNSPNSGATNELNFNGRGAGYRDGGIFSGLNTYQRIHVSNTYTSGADICFFQLAYDSSAFINYYSSDPPQPTRRIGNSVRLVKDSTSLSHGQTGFYTGNDGRIYRTICVSTKEFLADNLAETKYRNGNLIPEVSSNAAWEALSTAALCAYNNNWDYVPRNYNNINVNNKLKLGLVDKPIWFDYITGNQYINFKDTINIEGSKTIKFYMFQDKVNINNRRALVQLRNTPADYLFFYTYYNLATDQMQFIILAQDQTANMVAESKTGIPGLMYIEITKTTGQISSAKVNGISLTVASSSLAPCPSINSSYLGVWYPSSDPGSPEYGTGSIWGLEVENNHKWLGTPIGNQTNNWIDLIGTADGCINGTPGVINSPFGATQGFGSNKLMLNKPALGSYIILLTTRNSTTYTNFISYDNGRTFNMNLDLSTHMCGNGSAATAAPYLYISPNGEHLMVSYYSASKSETAWSHDRGITWDSSMQQLGSDGYPRCSDDGTYMIKGSWDNAAGTGIIYSKDGGSTWAMLEPSTGADNRKYVQPTMNANGKYILVGSQYSPTVKMIFSSNYGDDTAYLADIDNPSFPSLDGFTVNPHNMMSANGKYMLNLPWGVVQNSSDYGYSWTTWYDEGTYSSSYYTYGAMSLSGQYQAYQKAVDSSIFFSNDYGVSFSSFSKNTGGTFSCKVGWMSFSLDMMNMIGIGTNVRDLWRNKNFNSAGWYISYTFSDDIMYWSMSSDGNIILIQTNSGDVFYSWDGGDTFSLSSFVNPLAPTNYFQSKIN